MPQDYKVILEIGSGSFKLHKEDAFSERFQSSLGKDLGADGALAKESLAIAFDSIRNGIIPFLREKNINPSELLVFATAAIRESMKDPAKSGEKFIADLENLGFKDIKVFSGDEESKYGAMGVLEEFPELLDIAILDTGGASHQLIEVKNRELVKMVSKPIGSHSDLSKLEMPDFLAEGFSKQEKLILIGTSGKILTAIPGMNYKELATIRNFLVPLTIEERRAYLKTLIPDETIYEMFVDYRLQIMPNAFALISHCAKNIGARVFYGSGKAAKNYISKYGFDLD